MKDDHTVYQCTRKGATRDTIIFCTKGYRLSVDISEKCYVHMWILLVKGTPFFSTAMKKQPYKVIIPRENHLFHSASTGTGL